MYTHYCIRFEVNVPERCLTALTFADSDHEIQNSLVHRFRVSPYRARFDFALWIRSSLLCSMITQTAVQNQSGISTWR